MPGLTGWKYSTTDERTDRPFYRTLPISAGDPKSATAVNWHLKVKDRDYDVGLTKCYCIKVSMQKNQLNS